MRSVIDGARGAAVALGICPSDPALTACFAISPSSHPPKMFVCLSVYLFTTKRKRLRFAFSEWYLSRDPSALSGFRFQAFCEEFIVKHSVARA